MKQLIRNTLGLLLALSFYNPAWGYMLGLNDVGVEDDLLATANVKDLYGSNNPSDQAQWINDMPGFDGVTFVEKTEPVSASFVTVDGSKSIYAFELAGTPEYFVVKNAQYSALFRNNSDYGWGVIDALALGALFNYNEGKIYDDEAQEFMSSITISHVSEFGAVEVSEPGTMALFGLGLLGLVYSRRKIAA